MSEFEEWNAAVKAMTEAAIAWGASMADVLVRVGAALRPMLEALEAMEPSMHQRPQRYAARKRLLAWRRTMAAMQFERRGSR